MRGHFYRRFGRRKIFLNISKTALSNALKVKQVYRGTYFIQHINRTESKSNALDKALSFSFCPKPSTQLRRQQPVSAGQATEVQNHTEEIVC